MLRRILVAISTAIILTLSPTLWAANVSGSIRGVTFFYLDGVYEDFPWILDHLNDPHVQAKINNLFAQYRAAGVNWIRLLVAPDFFETYATRFGVPCSTQPQLAPCGVYPAVNPALISEMNQFLAMASGFQIELNLNPHSVAGMPGYVCDSAPLGAGSTTPNCSDPYYYNDKTYFQNWFTGINMTNIGIVMLGGGMQVCNFSGCDREGSTSSLVINNGEWMINVWAWKKANYPALNASYEAVGVIPNTNNSTAQIKSVAWWMDHYTPGLPYNAMSLYVSEPIGTQWGTYATATDALLDAYAQTSNTPLWIDEYGASFGRDATEADQYQALLGFLGASVCQRINYYPKFAWVAGNDYPYDQNNWFGLVTLFNGGSGGNLDTPVMRQSWNAVNQWYNLQSCP